MRDLRATSKDYHGDASRRIDLTRRRIWSLARPGARLDRAASVLARVTDAGADSRARLGALWRKGVTCK